MINLIFAVDSLIPPLTGVGNYAWQLARRFEDHRDIEHVRFYLDGRWIADPASLTQAQPSMFPPARSFLPRPPRWLGERMMRRACRSHVFHSPNFFLPCRVSHGVITIHDLSALRFPETHPKKRLMEYERKFKTSLACAAHLIAVSETIRQEIIDYLAWPPDRVTAIAHGVDSRFAPRPMADTAPVLARYGLKPAEYVLCVSTLEPRKNIDRLMSAYRALPSALRTRYRLVLAGSKGWLSESLQASIKNAEQEGSLQYLGYVPDADLPALYAGSQAFIYPSLYEGFGLPLLEALASGIPTVTSNTSAMPEAAGGAALLVDPLDTDALRDAIERAVLDDQWRAQARARGLEVARQHTWDRCVAQTVDVYRRVAPEH